MSLVTDVNVLCLNSSNITCERASAKIKSKSAFNSSAWGCCAINLAKASHSAFNSGVSFDGS